ncbi:ATG10 / autophagy protein 10 [Leishmania donovani]|nr:hypothetical protein, conserved [Leishmania donovani]CAJ1991521.1 ATG10 / autophagy protein 10 [Leishmania donovani]CBZ36721.1 hypothetical protein, conserved [Leishmania donovani]VDZ47362.1 autophagy_protein_10_(ATG10)/GeneDB:LmjF.31.3105 [Leishmania donovani]
MSSRATRLRLTEVAPQRCRLRAAGLPASPPHETMKTDTASVHCTRASFAQFARQRCADSPWELRSKRDPLGAPVEWLEATYNVCSSFEGSASAVLITVCVLFNADFAVPQLGFYNSTVTSLEGLRMAVPNLTFVNAPSTVEPADVAGALRRPLVSFSWNQELGQYMWLVHPCDTENLLLCRRYDGEQGDILSVFLRAMSDYFPFAPLLVPRAGGNFDTART